MTTMTVSEIEREVKELVEKTGEITRDHSSGKEPDAFLGALNTLLHDHFEEKSDGYTLKDISCNGEQPTEAAEQAYQAYQAVKALYEQLSLEMADVSDEEEGVTFEVKIISEMSTHPSSQATKLTSDKKQGEDEEEGKVQRLNSLLEDFKLLKPSAPLSTNTAASAASVATDPQVLAFQRMIKEFGDQEAAALTFEQIKGKLQKMIALYNELLQLESVFANAQSFFWNMVYSTEYEDDEVTKKDGLGLGLIAERLVRDLDINQDTFDANVNHARLSIQTCYQKAIALRTGMLLPHLNGVDEEPELGKFKQELQALAKADPASKSADEWSYAQERVTFIRERIGQIRQQQIEALKSEMASSGVKLNQFELATFNKVASIDQNYYLISGADYQAAVAVLGCARIAGMKDLAVMAWEYSQHDPNGSLYQQATAWIYKLTTFDLTSPGGLKTALADADLKQKMEKLKECFSEVRAKAAVVKAFLDAENIGSFHQQIKINTSGQFNYAPVWRNTGTKTELKYEYAEASGQQLVQDHLETYLQDQMQRAAFDAQLTTMSPDPEALRQRTQLVYQYIAVSNDSDKGAFLGDANFISQAHRMQEEDHRTEVSAAAGGKTPLADLNLAIKGDGFAPPVLTATTYTLVSDISLLNPSGFGYTLTSTAKHEDSNQSVEARAIVNCSEPSQVHLDVTIPKEVGSSVQDRIDAGARRLAQVYEAQQRALFPSPKVLLAEFKDIISKMVPTITIHGGGPYAKEKQAALERELYKLGFGTDHSLKRDESFSASVAVSSNMPTVSSTNGSSFGTPGVNSVAVPLGLDVKGGATNH